MKTQPEIYTMKLHETVGIRTRGIDYWISRVPGGWLYHYYAPDHTGRTTTFVPFDNEFMKADI